MKVRITNFKHRKTSELNRITNTLSGRKIYVSISGNNINDGGVYSPVYSLKRALELSESALERDVSIYINKGVYQINETLTINSKKNINIIGIGNVVFNGSKTIIMSTTDDPNILTSSTDNKFYQLFINGEKRFSASTPRPKLVENYIGCHINDSISTYVENGITYQKMTLSTEDILNLILNDNYKDGWITVFHNWVSSKSRITSVNQIDNTISFITEQNPSGQGSTYPSYGDKIIFENFNFKFEYNNNNETFTPGTFYLKHNGNLFYYLKDGETIDNINVNIPILDVFFNIYSKINFYNINFCASNYELFDSTYTCTDTQSAYAIDASVRIYGKNVNFYKCEFYDLSQTAICYMNGSSYSVISQCYFHNIGCSSIRIGELNRNEINVPKWIIINNCVIEYIGELLQQSAGIIITFAANCRITHCDISKTFYTGITSGHVWGTDYLPTEFKQCYIGYNKVHHISCHKMSDLGGIYNLGNTRGLVIENNIINDVYSEKSMTGHALYIDESSVNMIVRNNIFYRSRLGAHIHMSKHNYLYNNIFAYYSEGGIIFNGSFYETIYKNIFYSISDNFFPWGTDKQNVYSNMYWKIDGSLSSVNNDLSPIIANPYFNNSSNFDFNFSDMTSANLIGFTPINTDKVGVIGNRMKSILTLNNDFYTKYESIYE